MRVTRDKPEHLETAPDASAEETMDETTEETPELVDAVLDEDTSVANYTPNYPGHGAEKDEAIAVAMAQLKAQLNEPLAKGLTRWRKGYGKDEHGNQKMLEYLEWHTVTRQLNRIFGPSNWEWEVKDIKTFGEDPESGVPCVVTAVATLTITWPNNEITTYTNNGVEVVKQKEVWENRRSTGRYEPRTWEAFEMAFKGAAHDALKRAATALGEQFGLALYVKEEETKKARVAEVVVDGDTSAATTTTTATAPAAATASAPRREAPRQAPRSATPSKFQTVAPEDYDPEADAVESCEECGNDIRGYYSERLGRVYTTADLVAISKRKTGGQTLCYNCQQKRR